VNGEAGTTADSGAESRADDAEVSAVQETESLTGRCGTDLAEADVVTDIWSTHGAAPAEGDFGPVKVCRNARGFSFDGLADDSREGDKDLGEAWRRLLVSEGKASPEGETLRRLVLGTLVDSPRADD